MQLRPACPEDAEGIETLRVATWKVAYRGILSDDYLAAKRPHTGAELDRLRGWITEEGTGRGVWVGEDSETGELRGFVHFGPSRDQDGAGGGEIYALYVLPEAWGSGLGRRLTSRGLERLAAHGLDPVTLWVLRENPRARRFYEGAGFRPDGSEKQVDAGGEILDEVRYRR